MAPFILFEVLLLGSFPTGSLRSGAMTLTSTLYTEGNTYYLTDYSTCFNQVSQIPYSIIDKLVFPNLLYGSSFNNYA